MPDPSIRKSELAREVWRLMFDFFICTSPGRSSPLARRGLTPNDSRALFALDAERGRTMRALAAEWKCDASNVTWVVDRMERFGLAERRAAPHDRRVKLVALTSEGVRTRNELAREFHAPPPALLALSRRDLEELARALEHLPEACDTAAECGGYRRS